MDYKVRISDEENVDDILLCPNCGGSYLHHATVISYNRLNEDSPLTHVTRTETGLNSTLVEMVDSSEGNPSSRRDGIRIIFYCEDCGNDSLILAISQHKGNTNILWEEEQSPYSWRKDKEAQRRREKHNAKMTRGER